MEDIPNLQRMIGFYADLGINLKQEPDVENKGWIVTIAVPEKITKKSKIRGYEGFYVCYHFNDAGDFLYLEILE